MSGGITINASVKSVMYVKSTMFGVFPYVIEKMEKI